MEIRRMLADIIRANGIALAHDLRQAYLHRGCAGIVPRLPSIQLTIMPPNNSAVAGSVIIPPEEYIEVDSSQGHCAVRVELSDDNPHQYSIGMWMLDHVGVFFDYQNRQIGFCEPH